MRFLATVVVVTSLFAHPLLAQSLDIEAAKLKQQIEQLKQENQQLRQALTENPAVAATATPAAVQNQVTARVHPLRKTRR